MTRIPDAMDELQMRAFWRAWAARMNDSPVPKIVETPETIARVTVRR
jgi:hypothetical protein